MDASLASSTTCVSPWLRTYGYFVSESDPVCVKFVASKIVVVGNALMYEICARVADNVGFKYKETREACYMPPIRI